MKGLLKGSPGYEAGAEVVNEIIKKVNKMAGVLQSEYKPLELVIYIGHEQYCAIMSIENGDVYSPHNDEFMGFPTVRVQKDNYIHVCEKND